MMRPRTDLISEADALQYLPSSPLGAAVIYLGNHEHCWTDEVTTVKTLIVIAWQIFLGIAGGITDFLGGIRRTRTLWRDVKKESFGASPTC